MRTRSMALSREAEHATAIANGDRRKALTLLMAQYGEEIYRYAVAMTHDSCLAEEVRQQVFAEAYRDLGGTTMPASVSRWIFGIARHRCLDALRARTRWYRRFKNELPEEQEPGGCESDEELDRHRLAEILATCLTRLAPAARDAVVLRFQRELSYDEAATIAATLPATLRRRVARALPVLRKCVEAHLHRTGS